MNKWCMNDFPALVSHQDTIYLDSAATTQVPDCVTFSMWRNGMNNLRGNPGRGLYSVSTDAEKIVQTARETVAEFIGAKSPDEIVFTRNTTESLNLLASCMAQSEMLDGKDVLVSPAAHHSNLLPWVNAIQIGGGRIQPFPIEKNGGVSLNKLRHYLNTTNAVQVVAVEAVGNVYGYGNDLQEISDIVHTAGALLVVDGAQAMLHADIDVRKMDIDFLAFSGHKMLGPMGIGVLYGKKELLEKLPPYQVGGGMVNHVEWGDTEYAEIPRRFEAGTVNVEGCAGLTEAIRYIQGVGKRIMLQDEDSLTEQIVDSIHFMPGVRIIGGQRPKDHKGLVSFDVDGVHPHDVAQLLAEDGICVRAGHLCAQPLMQELCLPAVVRASVAFYNDSLDIEKFVKSLSTVRKRMGVG